VKTNLIGFSASGYTWLGNMKRDKKGTYVEDIAESKDEVVAVYETVEGAMKAYKKSSKKVRRGKKLYRVKVWIEELVTS